MALDKLVDSAQLDSDLGDVADAIRAKSGGSGSLAFPAGFISEIESIQTGGGGITPTGTKQIGITANGTTTEDVANYASAEITVNVPSGLIKKSGSFTLASDYTYAGVVNANYTGSILVATGLSDIQIIAIWSEEWADGTETSASFGAFLIYVNSAVRGATDPRYPFYYGVGGGLMVNGANHYAQDSLAGAILNCMTSTVPAGSFGFRVRAAGFPIKAGHTIRWEAWGT